MKDLLQKLEIKSSRNLVVFYAYASMMWSIMKIIMS